MRNGGSLILIVGLLLLAACKPLPTSRQTIDPRAAERGRAVIDRLKCGACHTIAGIDWPRGTLGPSLVGFDRQGLLAGTVPNTPDKLAAFIRNAPAVKPGSAMPAMAMSEAEASDAASYLFAKGRK